MPRCLEPDHHADFRALLVRHLLQRTTAHNRRQKTTFVSQFITQVLTKSSVNFNQVLRAMTRRFCAHWAKIVFSYSPSINNIQTISSFYGVDSEMLSSEKSIFENYDCRDPCQGKNAAVMVKTMHQQVSFGQIMFSPPNKIFPVRRCLNLLLLNCCVPPIPPKTVK